MGELVALEDKDWKAFKLGQIFAIEKVHGKPLSSYGSGDDPYISSSSIFNGFAGGFVDAPDADKSFGCCLSVDPITGRTFYHDYDFVGRGFSGASINVLRRLDLTKNRGLFLAVVVSKYAGQVASYSRLVNSKRLYNLWIMLPVTTAGEPDWEYMELYVKRVMQRLL